MAAETPLRAQTNAFEPVDCFEFQELTTLENANVECGYVTVPEQHDQPAGREIRLAVAIFRSTNPLAAAEPLVFAQGGPGGSSIELFSQVISFGNLGSLLEERDLVLFDQRGTLNSQPNLICSEYLALTERTIEQRLSKEDELRVGLEAQDACRARLVGEGINLAAFNSVENAADIAFLTNALGYQQIHLYGVSYGTLLALHTMRDHPTILRTVILDSVVPTQTNFIPEVMRSQTRAFRELFNACANDPSCNQHYPNLEQTFFNLLDRLDQTPVRVPLTDSESGRSYNAVLTGDGFLSITFQLLYAGSLLPLLPKMITDVERGDYTLLSRFWPLLAFDRTFASGMYNSVACTEDADFAVTDLPSGDIFPGIEAREGDDLSIILESCQRWNVPELGPDVDQPVVSEIPTLVLSGQFDPITPPAFADIAATTLSNSYRFNFPTLSHGVLPDSDCAVAMTAAFMNNPDQEPDGSCVNDPQTVSFITPDNTQMTTMFGAIFAALEQSNPVVFIALVALALMPILFLSFLLIWPIFWLVQRSRNDPPEQRGFAKLGPWLAVMLALVSCALLVGVLVLISMVSAGDFAEIILLVGLPTRVGWVAWLPPIALLLSLGVLIVSIVALTAGYWKIGRRIYYAFMGFGALIYGIALIASGLAAGPFA
jgi:pimeloyl-ACP methyl ester carboxylesterase